MSTTAAPEIPVPTPTIATSPAAARHRTTIHPFTALDGVPLTLVHVTRGDGRPPTRGPVMLVHGSGVRAELFRPPIGRTFVDALLDEGWDVWLLNWRASIDLPPLSWTLDDAAAYDHPAAVQEVCRLAGVDRIRAFVHCQGSTSFTIAAVSGLVPQVETVVSNAVSLHPVIPAWSRFKISAVAPVVARFVSHLSPAWGDRPVGWVGHTVRGLVKATHHECDNTVCRMVSFTYGAGFPALWSHKNLDDATHEWVRGEFGDVPLSFFAQMRRSVRAGHLVPAGTRPGLPASYVAEAPKTDARFVFVAGADNRCFLPLSQQRTYAWFSEHRPGKDALHMLPGYGHLDVLVGKNAARDTYPLLLAELAA
ncbi:MAG: esterase [Actinomycetes bacterium]